MEIHLEKLWDKLHQSESTFYAVVSHSSSFVIATNYDNRYSKISSRTHTFVSLRFASLAKVIAQVEPRVEHYWLYEPRLIRETIAWRMTIQIFFTKEIKWVEVLLLIDILKNWATLICGMWTAIIHFLLFKIGFLLFLSWLMNSYVRTHMLAFFALFADRNDLDEIKN